MISELFPQNETMKKLGEKVLEAKEASPKPDTKNLEDMLNMVTSGFDKMLADDGQGITAIMSTLYLPEPEFAMLSEIMLNEMEKAVNHADDKLALVQYLNASGMKVEEFNQSFVKIIEEIDKTMSSQFSEQKVTFLKRFIGIFFKAVNDTVGIAKRIVPVAFELCHPDAKKPEYANLGDGAMDVYALEDITINPGETKIIPIGVKVALPLGYALLVHPRSGLSAKSKMRVANGIGLIDAGYRGEIGVIIENIEPNIKSFEVTEDGRVQGILYGSAMHISKGERFAQLRLVEVPAAALYEVANVSEIGFDRASGFGGTGQF